MKRADRNALIAHEYRTGVRHASSRYSVTTYAIRIQVSPEAIGRKGGMPNLSNRWYTANGKRGGSRRRYRPYWGEAGQ